MLRRSKKFSRRSRTGCLTCRRRRIKCDENKPTCVRCAISHLDCRFPGQAHSPSKDDPSSSTVPSIPSNDCPPQQEFARARNLRDDGPSWCGPGYEPHPAYPPTTSSLRQLFPEYTSDTAAGNPTATFSQPFQIRALELMHPPQSSPENKVVDFLTFHHKFVISSHYFWCHDPRGYCSGGFLNLANNSNSMRYAVAAYAALLFSVFKRDRKAREYAFLYYAQSVYCVQAFLSAPTAKPTLPVLATILELTSFEGYRHLEGAARILQLFHKPNLYKSPLGRCLLEWFWNLETSFTIRLYRPLLLPVSWRDEALRLRRDAMKTEYPLLGQLSRENRLARLLDDAWQEFWAILPAIMDATLTVMTLNQLRGQALTDTVDDVEKNAASVWEAINRIKNSDAWSPLFEITEVPLDAYSKLHSSCCPPPPFRSHLKYSYIPAAKLDLFILSIRRFIHRQIYMPVQNAGFRIEWIEEELERVGPYEITYEMSRIFAAIEEGYQGYPGALMPLLRPLIMAGSACDGALKDWFWHKLAHFEESGSTFIEPVKRQLAIFWGIPELLTRGFAAMKSIGPHNVRQELDSEALRAAGKVALQEPPERPRVVAKDDLDLDESL